MQNVVKEIDLLSDFTAGVCLSETPSAPMTPLHSVYCILIHTGKGGGELNQREGYRCKTVYKAGSNICTNITDCISRLQTLINTCCKVSLQGNFLDDDILLWSLYS